MTQQFVCAGLTSCLKAFGNASYEWGSRALPNVECAFPELKTPYWASPQECLCQKWVKLKRDSFMKECKDPLQTIPTLVV